MNFSDESMDDPKLVHFELSAWAAGSAQVIDEAVNGILAKLGRCNIMLTGGKSASLVYRAWKNLHGFQKMQNVNFYFGDERCVSPEHIESNYGMALKSLFDLGIPKNCSIFRMEADSHDPETAALRYANILPSSIDVLLLSVGEDGHIASLFPNSAGLQERVRWVIPVTTAKLPHHRLTITRPVINSARSIFVFGNGISKVEVLTTALKYPREIARLPVLLASRGTWLMAY